MQLRLDGQHRGVEAFQMSGLQDAFAFFRSLDQVVGFGEARGQGLLDQQVQARIQQRRGHRMMLHRGDGNRSRGQLEVGGQQFVHRRKNGNRVFGRGLGGALGENQVERALGVGRVVRAKLPIGRAGLAI